MAEPRLPPSQQLLLPKSRDERASGKHKIGTTCCTNGRQLKCGGPTFALALIGLLLAIVALALVIYTLSYATANSYAQLYEASTNLRANPYSANLGNSLLAMTLPNDLSPYVGKRYSVCSATADAHTLTIQGAGSTWDGVNTKATFPGTVGACLYFRGVSATRLNVESNPDGVVFS